MAIIWNDTESPAILEKALNERRFIDAEELIKAFLTNLEEIPRPVPMKTATKVLGILRSFAWFDWLYQVAGKIEACGQDDPEVQRQLAQARIEQGDVTNAIEGLFSLRENLEEKLSIEGITVLEKEQLEYELGEAFGLLGRSYKQLYVDAQPRSGVPRKYDLDQALTYYGQAFNRRLGDYLWHGVNYIALLTHAERIKRGKDMAYSDEARRYAEEILNAIDTKKRRGPLQPWDLANRVEALLAQGSIREAIPAMEEYLNSEDLNAFNVQSTRRQLEQLWMLNEDQSPGRQILPMMIARFTQLGGGQVKVNLAPGKFTKYETIWGDTQYQPLEWLLDALKRACCVARLGPNKYKGWGTGFLFDGSWISEKYTRNNLLLTNAHVCTADKEIQKQYPYPKGPENNKAVFLGLFDKESKPIEIKVLKQIWTSPPSKLDATLLEIDTPPDGSKIPPLAEELPKVLGPDARVNILGHPQGMELHVSLQDNEVVNVSDPFLHYQTPTDPGSSGSPVFDQSWKLVALHHSSSAEESANEGIRMDRIIEAMRKELV